MPMPIHNQGSGGLGTIHCVSALGRRHCSQEMGIIAYMCPILLAQFLCHLAFFFLRHLAFELLDGCVARGFCCRGDDACPCGKCRRAGVCIPQCPGHSPRSPLTGHQQKGLKVPFIESMPETHRRLFR